MKHAPSPHQSVLPAVAALTIMWGTNWGLFPVPVREVSVWTFRSLSLLCAAVAVLLIAKFLGYSLQVPRRERLPLIASALCYMFIWHIGSTYAAILLPSGQAAVLGFTMPIWATLILWLVFGEKPSARLFAAVLLSGIGIAALAFSSWSAYDSAPLGFTAGLGAAFGWAVGTIILQRSPMTTPSVVSTGWHLLIAGIPVTIIAFIQGTREFFIPSLPAVLVIVYITFIPMSLGNIAWFQIVNSLPATVSGISIALVPILAMLIGAVFLNEPFGLLQVIAMVSTVCAIQLALNKGN